MKSVTPVAELNPDGRRVALYLRAACVSQNDPSAALDRQRRVLLDVVSRYTLEIVAEYSDAPASGLDPERPGLNRLLNDSKADRRTFDIVIVESPSRLSLQASVIDSAILAAYFAIIAADLEILLAGAGAGKAVRS